MLGNGLAGCLLANINISELMRQFSAIVDNPIMVSMNISAIAAID